MYLDYFPAGFITSFLLCLGLIFLDKQAAQSGDVNIRQTPQTLHQKSISRFGGVAILVSVSLVLIMAGYGWNNSLYFQVGILSIPAFLTCLVSSATFSVLLLGSVFILPALIVVSFSTVF